MIVCEQDGSFWTKVEDLKLLPKGTVIAFLIDGKISDEWYNKGDQLCVVAYVGGSRYKIIEYHDKQWIKGQDANNATYTIPMYLGDPLYYRMEIVKYNPNQEPEDDCI